jgi:hypothetical protein
MVESGNGNEGRPMPMRGTTIVAALFAAGAIMTTGALAQETKTDTPAVQETLQWPAFRSPERGFEIAFPTTPKATSSSVAGQNPLIRYNFEAYEGDDTVYRLVVLEYPAGKAPSPVGDSLYVKMVSAYAKDSESKVRKRGPKTIAGRDGFEAITDDGKGKVNHLVSIVPAGDRIYMLVSAGPRGHATSEDAERFRSSFRVTDGEPATTGSTSTPSP